MGVFGKKAQENAQNDIDQALINIRAKIVGNFASVVVDNQIVTSNEVADAAERLLRVATAKNYDALLEYVAKTSVWINSDVLTKSPGEKAQILFNVVSGSAAIREFNTKKGNDHLNKDVTLISMAFYSHLESQPDFDEVLNETKSITP